MQSTWPRHLPGSGVDVTLQVHEALLSDQSSPLRRALCLLGLAGLYSLSPSTALLTFGTALVSSQKVRNLQLEIPIRRAICVPLVIFFLLETV